jgi:hypothetical protein
MSRIFHREDAQRWLGPQPKEFYREGAKSAKLKSNLVFFFA